MGLFRPTTAEIDLGALRHNYRQVAGMLPPSVRIMAMIKADAYGHGAVQVAKVLSEMGVASLGVATVEEGLELRDSNIKAPVLVLGGLMGVGTAAAGMMVGADLTPVVHSAGVLDFLEATAHAAGKTTGIHLKIDTGMTRLGVLPAGLENLLNKLKTCKSLRLDGVMTHLALAEEEGYTAKQLEIFKNCISQVEKAIGSIPVWHVANSSAIFTGKYLTGASATEHWVRPGHALYGADKPGFRQVMSLKSKVVMIKSVTEGTKISYGCTYETRRPSRIGVVPIGYADGYPWALSNKAEALVHGRRVKVVGRVTMDMIMLDLTDISEAHIGDEVVLMGRQGSDQITVNELCGWAGTISYEIWCGISKRMPRVYID
jgi:alanine racemase